MAKCVNITNSNEVLYDYQVGFTRNFLTEYFFLFLNDKNVIGSDIGVVAGGTLKKLW